MADRNAGYPKNPSIKNKLRKEVNDRVRIARLKKNISGEAIFLKKFLNRRPDVKANSVFVKIRYNTENSE